MIFIGLGANLPGKYGEPEATINLAMEELGRYGISLKKISRIWLTQPVPVSDQPWYRNAVVAVNTELSANELLKALNKIEADFGRVRSVRNAPRVLDLDLLSYKGEIFNSNNLTIPHQRMHERGFVLYPLCEIAPEWVHPVLGQNIADLIKNLPENYKAVPLNMEAA